MLAAGVEIAADPGLRRAQVFAVSLVIAREQRQPLDQQALPQVLAQAERLRERAQFEQAIE